MLLFRHFNQAPYDTAYASFGAKMLNFGLNQNQAEYRSLSLKAYLYLSGHIKCHSLITYRNEA